ncbi:hypothetical protein [Moraxella sp.]|uniref:hypothetical protein n=1 Tax=Moraxella sp. TaxID=479 RepID=UPI0026196F4C|nr:hypothetical protein [Moraxella sp.]MCP3897150.1 hypothetical protein [Moraxella sp.]
MSQSLLEKIASDSSLDAAYHWLCKARKDYHHNNDVWHVRFHRAHVQAQIHALLLAGDYRFEPVRRVGAMGGVIGFGMRVMLGFLKLWLWFWGCFCALN